MGSVRRCVSSFLSDAGNGRKGEREGGKRGGKERRSKEEGRKGGRKEGRGWMGEGFKVEHDQSISKC